MIADFTGQQFGDYRLLHKIGSGGFADVYVGEHVYLRTQTAIKLLQGRLESDDQKTFLAEARTLASLTHANIVRILDYGVADSIPFLIMDFASKGTLRQRYARSRILPLIDVASYVEQVASALQYAHDRKIVHQDVKPENLLIGANNEILLADFGMASFTQSVHVSNPKETVGTVEYMAPEQLEGEAIPASDQYSLGIIVYEWLRGAPPFHGTFAEVAYKQLSEKPLSIISRNLDVSVAVESVIMVALSKDPNRRFKSINAFANALRQASFPGRASTSLSGVRPSIDTSQTIIAPIKSDNVQKELTVPDAIPVSQAIPPPPPSSFRALEPVAAPKLVELEQKKRWRLSRRALILAGLGTTGLVALGGGLAWYLRKPKTNLLYQGHINAIYALAWSPDGARIVSGGQDDTAQVWDVANGNKLYTYDGHVGSVNGLMWRPTDGTSIVSTSADQKVHIWEPGTGNRRQVYEGHGDNIRTVAWSFDEKYIASGGDDKSVQIWDAASGELKQKFTQHTDRIWAVAWSQDSQYLASASADQTVKIWDVNQGREILTYQGHTNRVKGVTWSLDGKQIASCGDDREVQVWDVKTGNLILAYRGHTNAVNSVNWSPDGTRIASGGDDTAIHVWDVKTGELLFMHTGHSLGIHAIAWAPHGQAVASGSDDKTVQIWSPDS